MTLFYFYRFLFLFKLSWNEIRNIFFPVGCGRILNWQDKNRKSLDLFNNRFWVKKIKLLYFIFIDFYFYLNCLKRKFEIFFCQLCVKESCIDKTRIENLWICLIIDFGWRREKYFILFLSIFIFIWIVLKRNSKYFFASCRNNSTFDTQETAIGNRSNSTINFGLKIQEFFYFITEIEAQK